ncbi:MAG TPA: ABC transporter substrate-binding protein [Candidatus Limnocylindria bacterium]|jgi:branched-chain amino acid transport system substrate-binding protein|nr:ABC transporter substrate-binding protein [Candidatus Limnocylindria bacterium]
MKRFVTVGFVVALLMAGCGGGTSTSGGTPATATAAGPKPDIKIGLATAKSGAANFYNPQQSNGALLAVEQINAAGGIAGAKLQLIVEDDGSVRDQGITAFKKFIEQDKVVAILGPTLSAVAAGAHPVAQTAGVPVIAISNTGLGIVGKCDYGPCDWIFRASLGEQSAVPETVKAATQKLGLKKVVIIYGDGKFELDDLTIFKEAFKANGVTVSKEIAYTAKDVDFAPFVTQAKGESPDAIVASSLAGPAGKILDEVAKQMPGKRVIGGNGLNSAALLSNANAGLMVVGTAWSKASTDKTNTDFVAAYKAKFGTDPDQFAAQSYTATIVLADALKRSGNATDRAAVKKALEGVSNLATPLGAFSFTADHDVKQPTFVMTVKDGQFIPFQ